MSLPTNIIPTLPSIHQELISPVKTPDGVRYQMHESWHNFFSQLNTALQNNFSQEGIIVPKQSAANIAKLNITDPNKFGAAIYDSTNHVVQLNLNGVFKTITTS